MLSAKGYGPLVAKALRSPENLQHPPYLLFPLAMFSTGKSGFSLYAHYL